MSEGNRNVETTTASNLEHCHHHCCAPGEEASADNCTQSLNADSPDFKATLAIVMSNVWAPSLTPLLQYGHAWTSYCGPIEH